MTTLQDAAENILPLPSGQHCPFVDAVNRLEADEVAELRHILAGPLSSDALWRLLTAVGQRIEYLQVAYHRVGQCECVAPR